MVLKPSVRWKNFPRRKNIFRPIIQDLRKSGKEIINATVGDPVMHGFVNNDINQYLIKAINEGWNMYAHSSPWISEVKVEIANFEKKMRGADYHTDDILIMPGTSHSLFILHYSLLDTGDEILAADPSHYFTEPITYFSTYGARAVSYLTKEEDEWNPDIDSLRSNITEKTKAIFINNPNNPTGAVYDEKILKKIVDIAGEYELLLIGDEIYGLIVFDGIEVPSLATVAKDVPAVIVNGMSKYFMRTGWRMGYIGLHDPANKATEVMEALKTAASAYGHATRAVPTPILAAATMAYRNSPMKASIEFVKELEVRRDYIMKRIYEIEGLSCFKPKGALYAFPKVDLIPTVWKSDQDFLIDLLKEEQVLFNTGHDYGELGFGHFRTLLMPKIEIQDEIFNRVERFIKKHVST